MKEYYVRTLAALSITSIFCAVASPLLMLFCPFWVALIICLSFIIAGFILLYIANRLKGKVHE